MRFCHTQVNYNHLRRGCGVHSPFLSLCHISFNFTKHLNRCRACCLCSFESLSFCQMSTTNALSSQSRPAQAVFHIDTNSIIVSNYKYLGVFEWRLNYESYKTWIKLLQLLMGGEGAVKLSLRFNWPNVSKASYVATHLWCTGSVFAVSLNKISLSLITHMEQQKPVWVSSAACFPDMHI